MNIQAMNAISIHIQQWSAWMPGIYAQQSWEDLFSGTSARPAEDILPGIEDIPPMLRRRLSGLGKMALAVAMPLFAKTEAVPCVLCSRHGELSRTVQLLQSIAEHEPLSPMHFSLSVHNAIGGVASIARKDTSAVTAMASHDGDVAIALLEAQMILTEQGHDHVVCIVYDESLPDVYHKSPAIKNMLPQQAYAVAFLLSRRIFHADGVCNIALSICEKDDDAHECQHEPSAISLLRFMCGDMESVVCNTARHAWHWQKQKVYADA
ncbi:MAG: beta-ketoacyl synthase chain length factor [Planctomycetes bacterium]|nr:beta-ketoacyl synthase chain length factor [Planctomycetota bacterium]